MQEQLRNVQHIQATESAFAASLGSGGVVPWVQEQLRNVQHIQATESAFAASLESGGVVAWGDPALQPGARAAEECPAHASNCPWWLCCHS